MIIKGSNTRVSLWLNKKRFSKIEHNKLTITHGYSKHNKHLWDTFSFNTLDECFISLQTYLSQKNSSIQPYQKKIIQTMYKDIY